MNKSMSSHLYNRLYIWIKKFIGVEPQERLKVILLTLGFLLIISGYTIAKELKDSLFVHIVGREYVPWAKICSMLVLIPVILIYSKLVDILRKHHLLYFYTILYGITGLIIAYFLAHPTIGLANTIPDKSRWFGWFIYFFVEGYSPFVVSLFWAFVNSVTAPQYAKQNYPPMVAGSKLGGIAAAGLALWLLGRDPITKQHLFSDVANHQILFVFASLLLLLVPVIIHLLITHVPSRSLHGYEAAYRVDLQLERQEHKITQKQERLLVESTGVLGWLEQLFAWLGHGFSRAFSGLTVLVKYPYVLGIFSMIFFWEVVNVVFCYERLGVGKKIALTISDYSHFLFNGVLWSHFAGFIIALFGTRFIITLIGERRSLVLVPVVTGALIAYYLVVGSAQAVIVVFVIIRAINYAFAHPLRESLYIPTTKDVRFKSKSWIDAFGAKVAKGTGSYYNVFIQTLAPGLIASANGVFFAIVISLWIIGAQFLGRRFERAVSRNEVIGVE